MSDEEDGNVVSLHLSQNGQDEKVGGQSSSKDQNERKRKTPNESFSDHENNSSSEKDIRTRGKVQGTHRHPHQAHHQLHHLVRSHLQMMMMREVNLNLRNIKLANWMKLCFMHRLRKRNTSTTSLKNF